ncbi:hypothetical protein [Helicobacter sp. MIT 14-3879]|uniref:hypothetical protein n=1 Tax=Helicobacter sp. MIT 14-3879 TaxID=2040649 RepID=UPI0011C04E50|nr:hypothetical protein [Helicobacter sp. MIT 14-3879]
MRFSHKLANRDISPVSQAQYDKENHFSNEDSKNISCHSEVLRSKAEESIPVDSKRGISAFSKPRTSEALAKTYKKQQCSCPYLQI